MIDKRKVGSAGLYWYQVKNIMSNAALKNIAYITMFIDHFFAVIFVEMMNQHMAAGQGAVSMEEIYAVGRAIGRIAFVLFAYLAAEGFLHTRSRRNYLFRLGIFALVSEVPFDLAFSWQIVDWESQNIFFTLFLGVSAMAVWEWAEGKICIVRNRKLKGVSNGQMAIPALRAVQAGGVCLCCLTAYCLKTDYRYMGVLLIFAFYLTRGWELAPKMVLVAGIMFLGTWSANFLRFGDSYPAAYLFDFSLREMYGMLAFIPISQYNGRKGRQMPKAFCYGFYPVHLLLLYGAVQAMEPFLAGIFCFS